MDKNAKIYVAGHSGMVGLALLKNLQNNGFNNLTLRTHKELDLINQKDVEAFFEKEKPEYVFIAAAKVGGIQANDLYRGQFLYENLMIQSNIIHAAHNIGVKKLLFLGSACIYPRNAPQPIKEEYLLSGHLEGTNEPYAIAKIAGIKLCESYYKQHGDNFISIMPNNLFGPNDNFDLKTSHVLPALMRKFHEAKLKKADHVEVWGSGEPKREFLHVEDLADASVFLMKTLNADDLYRDGISHINVGSGDEISIHELALKIKTVVGYKGDLIFNKNYPDGTPRKLLDISKMTQLGWKAKIKLDDGLVNLYHWYKRSGDHSN